MNTEKLTQKSMEAIRDSLGNVNAPAEGAARGLEEVSSSAARSATNVSSATRAHSDFYSVLRKIAGGTIRAVGSGIKGIASAIKNSADAFNGFRERISLSNTALGHLFSSIQRIAFYRLIRAAIREVTAGLQEGVKNLYQWSDAMNGSFAQSMDVGASASLQFKNSIGAMLGPAIEAVIPLLV